MQNAKPNEPNKDELKKDEIFIGEDLGITVIEVAESDKEKKTSSEGLIVDLTKLSSQSIDFLKPLTLDCNVSSAFLPQTSTGSN